MTAHAFIFARGGSKGLPRKNVREIAGKPLIKHSIDTAFETRAFDRVFVSTEDDEIATVAQASGAEVIDRPLELAGDRSPEWLAWRHAITWVREHYGEFSQFVSLPATSPLRSVADVHAAIDKLRTSGADICISVTPASRNPYFNMVKPRDDGYVELVSQTEDGPARRQDAPLVYDVTTVVYAAKPEFVMRCDGLFEGKVAAIEVPKARAVDIDDIYDFMLAETIFASINSGLC